MIDLNETTMKKSDHKSWSFRDSWK